MECKWFAKSQRRTKITLKSKLMTDTHLTTKNYFNIPRYKLYYTDQPDGRPHRGTAILIKKKSNIMNC